MKVSHNPFQVSSVSGRPARHGQKRPVNSLPQGAAPARFGQDNSQGKGTSNRRVGLGMMLGALLALAPAQLAPAQQQQGRFLVAQGPPVVAPKPYNPYNEPAAKRDIQEDIQELDRLVTQGANLQEIHQQLAAMDLDDAAWRVQVYSEKPERKQYFQALRTIHQQAKANPQSEDAKALLALVDNALVHVMTRRMTDRIPAQAKVRAEAAKTLVDLYGPNYPFLEGQAQNLLNLHPVSLKLVLAELPEAVRKQIPGKVFGDAARSLSQKAPENRTYLNRVEQLLQSHSPDQRKTLLAQYKPQVQQMVDGALKQYIQAGQDEAVKSDAETLLEKLLSRNMLASAPDGLFDSRWNPAIDTLLNRVENHPTPGAYDRKDDLHVLASLSVLELRKNSGVQNPRIYATLLKQLKQNPQKHWGDYVPIMLEKIVAEEALANDNPPKDKRVLDSSIFYNDQINLRRISPDETLLTPVEDLVKARVTQPPPAENAAVEARQFHQAVYQSAIQLARQPFHRIEALRLWQESTLKQVAQAKPEALPEHLQAFRKKVQSWGLSMVVPERQKLVDDGMRHLKPFLKGAAQDLAHADPGRNQQAVAVMDTLMNVYPWGEVVSFKGDAEAMGYFEPALKRFSTTEITDEQSLNAFNKVMSHYLKMGENSPKAIEQVSAALSTQMDFVAKAYDAAPDNDTRNEVEKRQLCLVEGVLMLVNELGGRYPAVPAARRVQHVEPLVRKLTQTVLQKTHEISVLDKGMDLFISFKPYPSSERDEDKVTTDFQMKTVMPMLEAVMEGIQRIEERWHPLLRTRIYKDINQYFHGYGTPYQQYQPLKAKAIELVAKSGFGKNEEGLADAIDFVKLNMADTYQRWSTPLLHELMNRKKDDFTQMLANSAKQLQNNTDDYQQIQVLEQLVEYDSFLRYLRGTLSAAGTSDKTRTALSAFSKTQSEAVAQTVLDKLKTAKVFLERSGRGITVHNLPFHKLNDTLAIIFKHHPQRIPQTLTIIEDRLKTEADPDTRGMLYLTSTKLPLTISGSQGQTLLDMYEKGLISAKTPVESRYIGQAFAIKLFEEMFDTVGKEEALYSPVQYTEGGEEPTHIKELMSAQERLIAFVRRLEMVNKTGKVVPDPKTPVQNAFLNLVRNSYGYDMNDLLKAGLKQLHGMENPDMKTVDRTVLGETFRQLMVNTNNAVAGAGIQFYNEAERIPSSQDPWGGGGYEITSQMRNDVKRLLRLQKIEMARILERNWRTFWGYFVPDMVAARMVLYQKDGFTGAFGYSDKKMSLLKHQVVAHQDKKAMLAQAEDLLHLQFLTEYAVQMRNKKLDQDGYDPWGYNYGNTMPPEAEKAMSLIDKMMDGKALTDEDKTFIRGLDPESYKVRVTETLERDGYGINATPILLAAEEGLKYRFLDAYLKKGTRESGIVQNCLDILIDKHNGFKISESQQRYLDRNFIESEKAAKILRIRRKLTGPEGPTTLEDDRFLRGLDFDLYREKVSNPLDELTGRIVTNLIDESMRKGSRGMIEGFELVERQLELDKRLHHLSYDQLKRRYLGIK